MQQTIDINAESGRRIAFIQSSWHKDIVDQCRIAFVEEMAICGYAANVIDFFEVAGTFEIPLHAKVLAKSGCYSAVVGTGLVVDGGLYRHDFVAQAVITGLMQVQLETGVPFISAVLTPHHFHAHEEHQNFFYQHFLVKGKEAAHACVNTLHGLQYIGNLIQQQREVE